MKTNKKKTEKKGKENNNKLHNSVAFSTFSVVPPPLHVPKIFLSLQKAHFFHSVEIVWLFDKRNLSLITVISLLVITNTKW